MLLKNIRYSQVSQVVLVPISGLGSDGAFFVRGRGLCGTISRLQDGGPRDVVRFYWHLRCGVPLTRRPSGYRVRGSTFK